MAQKRTERQLAGRRKRKATIRTNVSKETGMIERKDFMIRNIKLKKKRGEICAKYAGHLNSMV